MGEEVIEKKLSGLSVRSLSRRGFLYRAGLRKRDVVVTVNGERVNDPLDFSFYAAAPLLELGILRRGRLKTVVAERQQGIPLGIDFYQKPVRRCANRCIFCFIDQMPPGLRSPLYIKDEDLSHSFLNGNYVTLSNATPATLRKIAGMGLSPIFISVHATDPDVRLRMLGIKKAVPVMEQLRFLKKNNISFHTQIVVCPGYNDGAVLSKTVKDLFSLGKNLLSIAVVPVGLTRFRTFPLTPVSTDKAKEICGRIGVLSDRDAARHGGRRLFLADEFFLKAGATVPGRRYYGEYPQIENGVGLVRRLFETWNAAVRKFRHGKTAGKRRAARGRRYLLLTSVSAFLSLEKIAHACEILRPGAAFDVRPVRNRFFGESVTVAGLLTAADVIQAIKHAMKTRGIDVVLLPSVMFNYAGFTLDGYSAKRLAAAAGVAVRVVSSIEEILVV
jgi:putative radical SAM enzyme (TIGR03279 family)